MGYLAKTSSGREWERMRGLVTTANQQWESYADVLGAGYRRAYMKHEETLKKMNEALQGGDVMYLVLSLLCMSFAGGIVGAVMAPFSRGIGKFVEERVIFGWLGKTPAKDLLAETITGTTKGILNNLAGKATQTFLRTNNDPYLPGVWDPHIYKDQININIAYFFTNLQRVIDDEMKNADDSSQSTLENEEIFKQIENHAVLNYPTSLPELEEVQRRAEIGMWIAWANRSAVTNWERAFSELGEPGRKSSDYHNYKRLVALDPIAQRLKILLGNEYSRLTASFGEISAPCSPSFRGERYDIMTAPVLNVRLLKEYGKITGDDYFRNLPNVTKSPDIARQTLKELLEFPPPF